MGKHKKVSEHAIVLALAALALRIPSAPVESKQRYPPPVILVLRFSPSLFFQLHPAALIMSSRQAKQMSTTGMHEIGSPSSIELDDANLARMGKLPVLKVNSQTEAL